MSKTGVSEQRSAPPVYRSRILVRFADCDPAGIVFYPRYMEMFNALVEDWCREELQLSFPDLIARGWGLPVVHLNVDFSAPSLLGDTLSAALSVRSIGSSSIHLDIHLHGLDGSGRVRGKVVLVMTDLRTHRAQTIPDELRARISKFHQPGPLQENDAHSTTAPLAAS